MRPELFHITLPDWMPIHDLPIRGYGAMLALGFLVAILVAKWRARREQENPEHIYNAAILALLGGVLGARLFDVIEYADSRYPEWWRGLFVFEGVDPLWLILGGVGAAVMALVNLLPWARRADGRLRFGAVAGWAVAGAILVGRGAFISQHRDEYFGFLEALNITSGGLTVYGGLILATLLVVPYLAYLRYRHGVNPLKLLDIIAPSLALGLAFGRMGCFLNGCCYGAPTDLPWGIAWPEGSIPWDKYVDPLHPTSMPLLHPSQLYSVVNALLIFVFLHLAYKHRKRHGVLIGAFFGLKAVTRFFLEMVRSDEDKAYLGMSISQVTGLILIVLVFAYFLWLRKSKLSRLDWQPEGAAAAGAAKGNQAPNHNGKRKKHRKP